MSYVDTELNAFCWLGADSICKSYRQDTLECKSQVLHHNLKGTEKSYWNVLFFLSKLDIFLCSWNVGQIHYSDKISTA